MYPEQAKAQLAQLSNDTADPRLKSLIAQVLAAIKYRRWNVAERWLKRAGEYEIDRRCWRPSIDC